MKLNTIIQGDCLEVMKKIESNSIDCLITDPPFSIGTTSTGNKGSWLDNNLIRPFFSIWFAEVKRVLKDEADWYINTDWRTYPFLYPIATEYLSVKNCIVWDYEWIKAGSHYRFSHEFILYGNKIDGLKRKFEPSKENRDVWRIPPVNFTQEKNHPAEKPVNLIKKMLENSTKKGDLVLDTFLGSGTTAVACKELQRNFIGIEIDPKYIKIANERLAQEVLF